MSELLPVAGRNPYLTSSHLLRLTRYDIKVYDIGV